MTLTRLSNMMSAAREDVRSAIGVAAQRTGVDFSYLFAQAKSESGLNPAAKASGSTATGLYQFLDQSWLGVVKQHGAKHGLGWAADAIQAKRGGGYTVDPAMRQAVFGLREQAGPASLMAAEYASDNADSLGRSLGRPANGTDLYFAHFLGLGGATKFLRAQCNNGSACAANLFPQEARANRSIFYARDGSARSLDQVYALMGHKLDHAGMDGGGAAATVASDPGALVPGSLVQSLPGAGSIGGVQLAYADMSAADPTTSGIAEAGSAPMDTLSALGQGRVDLLKPTPAQAKLAYLMLSMPLA
ncbi:transglycosylase SLT domain-containing protein [uncultured Sphingomonas sp.]|uniref:transglycosylase SLT domain-containing protein n=1 Tax=uncultured Sphingomonas sp. TaxID=158754 RepID=UPI0025DAE2B4|nr:transglycosylase SLT domain-containing protein [uncultured Sphingomonas sp.]